MSNDVTPPTPEQVPYPAPTGAPAAGGGPGSPGRRTAKWLLPTLGAVVAIGIGLVGGIAIGQHTASSSQASSGSGRQFGGFGAGAPAAAPVAASSRGAGQPPPVRAASRAAASPREPSSRSPDRKSSSRPLPDSR
ncbi:hypothetical protein [Frondihabitans sucicola]|uniref:hypothetical protein n=1 Tax=Frondihabitans sucicola TaxID=1268041 RepID=UPI002572F343|nr:hypothetical protein [Frondihabitans sucicola]